MSPYLKTLLRSIKGSFARFVAIFAIIALGVGFYGGLLMSQPSFIKTGDVFMRNQHLYDFRLISTIGFDEDDILELRKLDGVVSAEGAVFADAIISNPYGGDTSSVARFHTITDNINICSVTAGRMPERADEVVVDGYRFDESVIGKKLVLTADNDEDTFDSFNYTEYTVVGVVRSPYYINFQRGSSGIGNGQVNFYVYVPLDGMEYEYFTEAYLFYDTDFYIYSDEYVDWAELKQDELETQVQAIVDARYQSLLDDAQEELDDAYEEFVTEGGDAWDEIIEARGTLDDARAELLDSEIQLNDAQSEIDDGHGAIISNQNEIDNNRRTLAVQLNDLEEGQRQLDAARAEAEATRETLSTQLQEVVATQLELRNTLDTLNDSIAMMEQAAMYGIPVTDAPYTLEELYYQRSQVEGGLDQCEEGIAAIETGFAQVNAGLVQIDAQQAQIDSGRIQIYEGIELLDRAQDQIDSARNELAQGESDYNEGLNEYLDGYAEYRDGLMEYYNGISDFRTEMGNAGKLIGEGYMHLEKMRGKDIDIYVLGRDTNVGYVSLDNDAQIVAGVARVFPIFFFALAALVCSTTMQRMVGDERTQIGTMRALGYSEFSIVMKYVAYSGLAAVLGCVLGFFGGIKLFPYILWQVYGMMYGFSDVVFANDWFVFAISMVVSLLCSVGVTVYTAMSEMKGTPAELIRPKSPAAGKRILLERISFLWKPLKFTYKVSIRNVFRFKKRMFMMIIGIAGCTALLVTGFGIRDSVSDIVDIHYDKVLTYDISVTFKDDVSVNEMKNVALRADNESGVSSLPVIARTEVITHNGDAIRDVNLIVSDDPYIDHVCGSWVGEEQLSWPGDGEIAISSKLAQRNNIVAGDDVTFSYGDSGKSFTLRVAYVFDNYIYHNAYMNVATYEAAFGTDYEPDTMLIKLDANSNVSSYDYAQNLSDESTIKTWTVVADMQSGFHETMSQLNKVVILVIGCAAALAFIVLFNLNNINITERVREIATLKVLGFNRMETGSYVFRENVILVAFGFVFGVPLGILLNAFVITQIEMDMVTFVTQIYPISYLYSLGLVILFSVLVDLVMRGKIERIDMAESLKSIE